MRQDCSDCFRRCLGRVEVALCMAFLYDRPPEARSKLGRASLKINGSAIRIRSARHGVTHELEEHFQVEDTRQGLYAFTVVPRAPNFSALRRVSSNAELA